MQNQDKRRILLQINDSHSWGKEDTVEIGMPTAKDGTAAEDEHQQPSHSQPVNVNSHRRMPTASAITNWAKWGGRHDVSEEVSLALPPDSPIRQMSHSGHQHATLTSSSASTARRHPSAISSNSISISSPSNQADRVAKGFIRDYPDLADFDQDDLPPRGGGIFGRRKSSAPVSTADQDASGHHQASARPDGASTSPSTSPPANSDSLGHIARRNSNFGWLAFGKPSSPISVPLALRSVAAQQAASTSPPSSSPPSSSLTRKNQSLPRRGSLLQSSSPSLSQHISQEDDQHRNQSNDRPPNSPTSDRPTFVAADLPLPHREQWSLGRPPLPSSLPSGETPSGTVSGEGKVNTVVKASAEVDVRAGETITLMERKEIAPAAVSAISKPGEEMLLTVGDATVPVTPLVEVLSVKEGSLGSNDELPSTITTQIPAPALSTHAQPPSAEPEKPYAPSLGSISSTSLKSEPIESEDDLTDIADKNTSPTMTESSLTPSDPPRHRKSRLRSYQFLFPGASSTSSLRERAASARDSSPVRVKHSEPSISASEPAKRHKKPRSGVWSPIPLFRSSSAPHIDLVVSGEQSPQDTEPGDLPGDHSIAKDTKHRQSLDIIAARHLGVTEKELPRLLAEEGISRWAAVKATSIRASSASSTHSNTGGKTLTSAGIASEARTSSAGTAVTKVKRYRSKRHPDESGITTPSIASSDSLHEGNGVSRAISQSSSEGRKANKRRSCTPVYTGDVAGSDGSVSDIDDQAPKVSRRVSRRNRRKMGENSSVARDGRPSPARSSASSTRSSNSGRGREVESSDEDRQEVPGLVIQGSPISRVPLKGEEDVKEVGLDGGKESPVGRRKGRAKGDGEQPKIPHMVSRRSLKEKGEDNASFHTVVEGLDDDGLAVKRDFLIKLSRTFAMYGAPSHRLEYHLSLVSKTLEVEADYIVFPGFNMGKLAQVNALCLTLTHGLLDIYDAIDLLEAVRADQDYPWYIILATFPVTSFTLCILGFGGNWVDASIAAVLGTLVGVLMLCSERFSSVTYLLEFFASLGTAFIARSLQWILSSHGICFNYIAIVLSAIAILLPGLSLTISIIELSTRNMVSGTVRLFGALFTAMLLGFGMTIGGALVVWNSLPTSGTSSAATCGPPQSPLWGLLLFWPMSLAVNIFFQANVHQWPIMTASAALGWITSILLNMAPQFQSNTSAVTAISSLVIGLVSNLHSRLTHDVAVAPVLSGILLQVPGSLGVRSSLSFFVSSGQPNQIVDGVQFTFQMLTIGMALALGLFVATFLVWPMRAKYKYMSV
ncbi:hypothetical protein HDU67_004690 [Dinochytrium kinnereticum]|nr:hypothetical protein HDU67_004690 [Dinochytrium kinnereticum]